MLNDEQARRAIYLDFESEGQTRSGDHPPPILGGVRVDGVYAPTLLHPSLGGAPKSRGWAHVPLPDYLAAIHDRADFENRKIVFFTSTESDLFNNQDIDIANSGFDLRGPAKRSGLYRDVWEEFKSNRRRFRSSDTSQSARRNIRTGSFGLLSLIAEQAGMQRPQSYGAGKIGRWIRTVLEQADRKSSYDLWSPGGKRKLTSIVKHNEHDCKATQFVLEHLLRSGPTSVS